MLIDMTLEFTPQMLADSGNSGNQSLTGHLGTHFDVMDKTFPLEYTRRRGIVWDARHVKGRDISVVDVDLEQVSAERGTFVMENLCNLHRVLEAGDGTFLAHTYPIRCSGLTGLPCRVIAEVSPQKEGIC